MKISVKQIMILIIMLSFLMGLTTISNAGMEINGGDVWTKITASEAYEQCYNLRNSDSTLGVNSLDPHLTLNKDWGAVAYLAISNYGEVTSKTGPTISLGETTRCTTTGNVTGVIDFGRTMYTLTSSLLETDDGTNSEYRTALINNKGTKYVEILTEEKTVESTKGQALTETYGWFSTSGYYSYPAASAPVYIRRYIISLGSQNGYNGSTARVGSGFSNAGTTFRPVIWN